MPDGLHSLTPHVPAFLLVLFRLTGIFIFGPMFAGATIPMRIKAMLALTLAFCIYPLVPVSPNLPLSISTLAFAVSGEMLIGAVIGYGANLPLLAVQLGGVMMGQQLGLGLAQVLNPSFDEQSDVLGQVLFLTALTIFLSLDGHHAMIGALVGSFASIPLGGYMPDMSMLSVVTGLLDAMFALAVKVAAPLLCLVFLETVAMGFVARTVPQLNLLSLGFPLRILVGLGLIAMLTAAMFGEVTTAMSQTMDRLIELFAG